MSTIKETEKLNELKKEAKKLELMIIEYSLYNNEDLSLIISKLMTCFEGIQYCAKSSIFSDSDYYVAEKEHTINPISYNFPQFRTYIKNNTTLYIAPSEKVCLFGPSGYHNSMNDKTNKLFYIQEFADYLFRKRVEQNLIKIEFEKLEELLQDYLEITKDKQQERKNNRVVENEEREKERKLQIFKDKCFIDRRSFFNSIINIINNYCDDSIIATEKIYEKWERSSQWSTLNLYHKLIIKNEYKNFEFDTLIGSDSSFPDEEEYSYVDKKQDTIIKFYEVKTRFNHIYKNNKIFKEFIDALENLYDVPKEVTKEEVQEILTTIINKYEDNKQLSLKKHQK